MNASVDNVTSQDSVESTDLPEIRVYKRRWYILGLFGLLACHQCIVWNTFGPIESAVQYAYHWSNAEVSSEMEFLDVSECPVGVTFLFSCSQLKTKKAKSVPDPKMYHM